MAVGDDELLTTKHPRDPKGTQPLVKALCMQETLALCIMAIVDVGHNLH